MCAHNFLFNFVSYSSFSLCHKQTHTHTHRPAHHTDMCTFWVLYALMVRLRFFSFTSSKSVHWNFQTVVCCFLFGQCIPPEQQQQQRLSSLGFFDWKWQNSTFSVFMLTHQIMWFVIIWTKKGNQTVNDQTNGNIHSEFKKFDQKKTKIERARALSTVSWEVFLECMCVCVWVFRYVWNDAFR